MPPDPLGQVEINALELVPRTQSVLGTGVVISPSSKLIGGVVIKFG